LPSKCVAQIPSRKKALFQLIPIISLLNLSSSSQN
jgi:hypothetical protein